MGTLDVQMAVEERRQGANDAAHNGHRVRILLETFEKLLDALVYHHLIGHFLSKDLQLALARQVSVKQQEARLQEGTVRRQFVNGIAAVEQLTGAAVNVSDRAHATRCGCETRVVHEHARLLVQHLAIERLRSEHRLVERNRVRFAIRRLHSAVLVGPRAGRYECEPGPGTELNFWRLLLLVEADALNEVR